MDIFQLYKSICKNKCNLEMMSSTSEEVKQNIYKECEILFECRMCKSIFRSLVNFAFHKEKYCKETFDKYTNQCFCHNNNNKISYGETVDEITSDKQTIAEEESINSEENVNVDPINDSCDNLRHRTKLHNNLTILSNTQIVKPNNARINLDDNEMDNTREVKKKESCKISKESDYNKTDTYHVYSKPLDHKIRIRRNKKETDLLKKKEEDSDKLTRSDIENHEVTNIHENSKNLQEFENEDQFNGHVPTCSKSDGLSLAKNSKIMCRIQLNNGIRIDDIINKCNRQVDKISTDNVAENCVNDKDICAINHEMSNSTINKNKCVKRSTKRPKATNKKRSNKLIKKKMLRNHSNAKHLNITETISNEQEDTITGTMTCDKSDETLTVNENCTNTLTPEEYFQPRVANEKEDYVDEAIEHYVDNSNQLYNTDNILSCEGVFKDHSYSNIDVCIEENDASAGRKDDIDIDVLSMTDDEELKYEVDGTVIETEVIDVDDYFWTDVQENDIKIEDTQIINYNNDIIRHSNITYEAWNSTAFENKSSSTGVKERSDGVETNLGESKGNSKDIFTQLVDHCDDNADVNVDVQRDIDVTILNRTRDLLQDNKIVNKCLREFIANVILGPEASLKFINRTDKSPTVTRPMRVRNKCLMSDFFYAPLTKKKKCLGDDEEI